MDYRPNIVEIPYFRAFTVFTPHRGALSILRHDYIILIASCTLVTPMNENAPRSVCLVVLMIAAIALPLMQTGPPPDLEVIPAKEEVAANPCQGYDACLGHDAGGYNYGNEICPGGSGVCPVGNLTTYVDYGASETTTTFYGHMEGYFSPYTTDDDDKYSIWVPSGYGINATLSWNGTGTMMYGAIGSGLTGTYSGYDTFGYLSQSGVTISTIGTAVSNTLVDIYLDCDYSYCSQSGSNSPTGSGYDYKMEITTWPSDAGGYGDATQAFSTGVTSTWDNGDTFVGACQRYGGTVACQVPASTNNGADTGTKTLAAGESFGLFVNHDHYADTESTLTVTCNSGTQSAAIAQNDGFLPSTNAAGKFVASFAGPDVCTAVTTDIYNDGGIEAYWAGMTPPVTGLLTASLVTTPASHSGVVGNTDLSDTYAIVIPDGTFGALSLDWDGNVDLDLRVYTDSALTSLHAGSYYSQPETLDLSSLGDDITVYAKVSYYSYWSTDPASGYTLTLDLTPSVFPPCWFQDDGAAVGTGVYDGTGSDAPSSRTGATTLSGMSGSITGMVCDGTDSLDTADWFEFTVPADHGLWAMLEWTKNESTDYLMLYQYMERFGSQYSVSSSTSSFFATQAVSSNESYSWRTDLSLTTTSWIAVMSGNMVDDEEYNYTLTWQMYNQSESWINPSNDAGSGVDAGDSSYAVSSPVVLPSVNNTYTGHGHDYEDMYDQYKVYVPQNYGLHVVVSFPAQNDIDVFVRRVSSGTSLLNIASGYNDNPEDIWIYPDNGGQDLYIIVWTDRGSGAYTMDIDLITSDTDPDPEDDCGIGMDAADTIWTSWSDATWLNNSNQIDANGDANDTGGVCTGWISDLVDEYDVYLINIPPAHYLQWNVSWIPQPGVTVYTYMYKCQLQHLPCGGQSAYYVSQQYNSVGFTAGSTGLWWSSGGWAVLEVRSTNAVHLDYTMDIQFLSLASIFGGIQNDANSSFDAGSGAADAVHVNTYINQTGDTLNWQGWNHPSVDTTDRYTFDVPVNHGFEACTEHAGRQYGPTGSGSVLMIMDVYGTPTSPLPANTYVYYGLNPMCWSTNQSSDYFGGEAFMLGVRNWAPYLYSNPGEITDYNVSVTFFTLDADGDGWYDDMEVACGTDPFDNSSVPSDIDADGICDALDSDRDGDGVIDANDAFPDDANESSDIDGDGIGDNVDNDLDNDGWNNSDEVDCLTDPLDSTFFPDDFDGDGICDLVDADDDNDGYDDLIDVFPMNSSEWADNDNDFIGDNLDTDDDNDGYDDQTEIDCWSDSLDVMSIPVDQDLDGVCDALDTDLDGDGYDNDVDDFPQDPLEWIDTDGDGYGDNEDTDDDNDIVLDVDDAFPLDSSEWIDTDGDDVGDNADLNDDGDAWTDAEEALCGSDSLDADSVPDDYDNDGLCDKVDTDDDGDGWLDIDDAFPYDATDYTDLDGDGMGDFTDTDDDNDGWLDSEEPNCGTDPMDMFSVPDDNDRDHQCDIVDPDDDNDGTLDVDDDFPMNPAESNDLDGDGIGDNADNDDDGDDWLDVTEALCAAAGGYGDPMNSAVVPRDSETDPGPDGVYGTDDDDPDTIIGDDVCDALDPDWDGDGAPNPADPDNPVCNADLCEDFFPWDPTEKHDANGDGLGDRGTELTFMDNFQAEPMPFIGVGIAVIALVALVRRGMGGDDEDDFDEDADYTEDFLDDEELDEAIDEAFDEDDEEVDEDED